MYRPTSAFPLKGLQYGAAKQPNSHRQPLSFGIPTCIVPYEPDQSALRYCALHQITTQYGVRSAAESLNFEFAT